MLADVVLLNKRDLADEQTLARLEERIRQLNPRTEIIRTERAETDYARLLDRAGEISQPSTSQASASQRQTPVHDHFHTLTYLCEAPLVRERFEQMMRSLPDTVWRAKGFVRLTDSDEQWMFQYVAGEFDMEWLDLLPEPPEHVVFIGKGFDRAALRQALGECALASSISSSRP